MSEQWPTNRPDKFGDWIAQSTGLWGWVKYPDPPLNEVYYEGELNNYGTMIELSIDVLPGGVASRLAALGESCTSSSAVSSIITIRLMADSHLENLMRNPSWVIAQLFFSEAMTGTLSEFSIVCRKRIEYDTRQIIVAFWVPRMSTKNEILPLTGLRFIAALYVFLFHMQINWPFALGGLIKKIIEQGAVGMSIFFVLSGFLLAYQYSDRYEDKKDYFVKRLVRIYPIYIIAALSTIPWMWRGQIFTVWETTALVVTNIFVMQAWVPNYFSFWNDGGSWSISVEVFCYAILPFIAPWMSKLSNRRLVSFAVILYVWAVMPGQLGRIWPDLPFSFFYALPAFRVSEFFLGVCGFLAVKRGFKFSRPNLAVVVILIVFVILIKRRAPGIQYIGYNWMVMPVVVGLIISLCQSDGRISRLLSSRAFVWLGKISYCFYSFQALVLLLLIRFHEDLVASFPIFGMNWFLCIFAFVLLVLLSALGHHLIEEPCRRKIQKLAGVHGYKKAVKKESYAI